MLQIATYSDENVAIYNADIADRKTEISFRYFGAYISMWWKVQGVRFGY